MAPWTYTFIFLGSEMNLYSKAIGWLTWSCMDLGKYVIWVYVAKVFENCHFVQNFTPVDLTFLHWATDIFSNVLDNMQFEFM